MWIARDKSGMLNLFVAKPEVRGRYKNCYNIPVKIGPTYWSKTHLPSDMLPQITFESGPVRVDSFKITINGKQQEWINDSVY